MFPRPSFHENMTSPMPLPFGDNLATLNMIVPPLLSKGVAHLAPRLSLGWLSGFLSLLAIAGILYVYIARSFFSPLAKIPGPFLGRFSNLKAAYLSWRGDAHIDMLRAHKAYGSHVRYGPNTILVNSAQGVRDIYLSKDMPLKSRSYDAMTHLTPNTLTARDPQMHAQKRRRLAAALSDEAMRHYEPIIAAECDRLCTLLKQSNRAWNMSHLFDHLSFDIMTQIVFGKSFNTLTEPFFNQVIDALKLSHVRIGVIAYMPIVGYLKLDRVLLLKSLLAAKTFLTFMYTLMKWKLSAPTLPPRDVLSYLMNPNLDSPPRKRELYAEAPLLIVGASDTTSTTLAALFFYLSKYPTARNTVLHEVRATFADPSQVRMGAALTSCAYLRACIEESLRLCPPVPGPLIREVSPRGMVVDGVWLPGGTEVASAPYCVHRNPDLFDEPDCFQPERWIVDEAKGQSAHAIFRMRNTFMAFSVGARSCVGKKLGMLEVSMIAARILLEFDFDAEDDCTAACSRSLGHIWPEFVTQDHLNAMKDGPVLKFRDNGPFGESKFEEGTCD